ncbi:MAG: hypothetical protein HY646_12220 [Acidobacteria bacterium]|nr:hypothetical protein [Acidobacteriota bacterium]
MLRKFALPSSAISVTVFSWTVTAGAGALGEELMKVDGLNAIIKSQYHASLAMLREAIELCDDRMWLDTKHVNACWQVAYHTLFFTQLYLGSGPNSFRGWAGHQAAVQHPDGMAGPADPNSSLPLIPKPYPKAQTLEYWSVVDSMVDEAIDSMDLAGPDSGFWWYKVSKFEHQLINIRHVQHGAAQLADRVRAEFNVGVRWVGSVPGA